MPITVEEKASNMQFLFLLFLAHVHVESRPFLTHEVITDDITSVMNVREVASSETNAATNATTNATTIIPTIENGKTRI